MTQQKPTISSAGYHGPNLSEDAKTFLLSYPPIAVSLANTQAETKKLLGYIAGQLAHQKWCDASTYTLTYDWRTVQLWARHWHYKVTPDCPWVHLEYGIVRDHGYVEASLDIEGQGTVPPERISAVADCLRIRIQKARYDWLVGQGWILSEGLIDKRMLLQKRTYFDKTLLSGEWLSITGMESMAQLAQTLPDVEACAGGD